MTIELLDWDTKFFGFNVGLLSLNNISKADHQITLRNLKDNNFKLIYIFIPKIKKISSKNDDDFKSLLSNINAKLVDEKIIFSKLINNPLVTDLSIERFTNNKENLTALYKLALLSGQYSRFRLDENFSLGKFEEMYKLWVDNSVNRKIADEIFVYLIKDKLCGFVTIKMDNTVGKIGLISVDPKFQGLSIGKKLINSCETYCYNNGVNYIDVATQLRNKGAFDFYTKCGFNVKEVIEIYHLWL